MIFTIKSVLEMIFTIKMHWKWFYYKNALEMIYTYKKCIGNDFIIKMHWKLFLL